jgi:hypothetical protein
MDRRTEPDPRKEDESREHGRSDREHSGERRPMEKRPELERGRENPSTEREGGREGERREQPRKFGERREQPFDKQRQRSH